MTNDTRKTARNKSHNPPPLPFILALPVKSQFGKRIVFCVNAKAMLFSFQILPAMIAENKIEIMSYTLFLVVHFEVESTEH